MIIVVFFIGLMLGIVIGAKMYSYELNQIKARKAELAAIYYRQLDELNAKIENLEEELRNKEL